LSVFSCKQNSTQIQSVHLGEPFTISINIIGKQLAATGRNISRGPDGISGDILKLCREATILYLARLLDTRINKAAIPRDWKKATVVRIYKGGDSSVVTNYRLVTYSQWYANKWSTSLQGT
jgi:hypothetical protein